MSILRRRKIRYILLSSVLVLGLLAALSVSGVLKFGNRNNPSLADFGLSSNPSSIATVPGTDVNTTINVSSLNNFAGTVVLSASSSPAGLITGFGAGSVRLTSGGIGTSKLSISVPQTVSIGSYSITVSGTNGSTTHSTTVSIIVTTPEIRISYSSNYNNSIRGLQPPSGSKFLIVHLTVQNLGYHNFTADPFRDMNVTVDGQVYNVSAAYLFLPNMFPPSINLNNTQSASGDVVFQVPQTSTTFTPGWRILAGEQIRFDWVPS